MTQFRGTHIDGDTRQGYFYVLVRPTSRKPWKVFASTRVESNAWNAFTNAPLDQQSAMVYVRGRGNVQEIGHSL